MPNSDFYAYGDDHRLILDFLFNQKACRVFDATVDGDCDSHEFLDLASLQHRYGISDWGTGPSRSITLVLYADGANGDLVFSKTEISSRRKFTGDIRSKCEGWGVVHLYLNAPGCRRPLPSHSNHNTETRARNWRDTISRLGNPDAWDWGVVVSFSRKLNCFIRSHAVYSIGSRPVLPVASLNPLVAAERVRGG